MKSSKVLFFIIAASFALIALVLFQVKWMMQSRDLIEEQFNHKVSMALCKAVENIAETEQCMTFTKACSLPNEEGQVSCLNQLNQFLGAGELDEAITKALSFYNINLGYEISITESDPFLLRNPKVQPYSCSLNPILEGDEHRLNINFPGKAAYILEQMGFMVAASILIVLFISIIFALASYYLLQQKRVTERNIDFFNNMAHEFQTPLTNIGLATKLLTKKHAFLKTDNFLNIVRNENQHLKEQVERVLHLARLENDEFRLHKEIVHLGNLLECIMQDMEIQIREKEGQIYLDNEVPDIIIHADKLHLKNAIRNLIDNALKYSINKPIIHISIQRTSTEVHIKIQDNGLGISKKDQALVFKKFQRVNQGNLYSQKGFGLGLSYVKKIIEMHKGVINVMSELQKGTRFDLYLPLNKIP